MATRRVRVRPPGVKTGSTIGPLGPFRGTLGIHWVIGAIVVGLLIVLAGSWFLFREPQPPFERVTAFTADDLQPGVGREAFAGVYVGMTEGGQAVAVRDAVDCPIRPVPGGYVDCLERRYGIDGDGRKESLQTLPVRVHDDAVYVDTSLVG